ncbi:hypothetical protein J7E73_08480 [Paenibacillus albidus]|uniref:hypothetical protein n=1 Tax=Paenibacillus albidus TaxID=2041023 RepID=UPI001BEC9E22|nr:hypothetical protein [Paenibacillus albidus]MBT2289167.1 hypothetical protein [Paenibacillus albidus]
MKSYENLGAYRIDTLPDGLKIIQRGNRVEHFEIVPLYDMPLNQFQDLLNQIIVSPQDNNGGLHGKFKDFLFRRHRTG